jgi:hypothetical protein
VFYSPLLLAVLVVAVVLAFTSPVGSCGSGRSCEALWPGYDIFHRTFICCHWAYWPLRCLSDPTRRQHHYRLEP